MMKSISYLLLALAAASFTACQKTDSSKVKKNTAGLPAATQGSKAEGLIAYVEVDSLATQYEYCKEGQKNLEAKQANYRKQLENKAAALQRAMTNFQNKYQQGKFTSQQEAEKEQASLQKQQQQLQQMQGRFEEEMAKAAEDYQKVLRDSLNNYLKVFNADGRYKMILSKSGDNILYADKSLDITNTIIAGLNKRYKKK